MIEMVLNTLPKIAAEIAAPLGNVASIKIVSGEGGEVGISRITGEVIDIMGKLPETIDKLTGINITKARARNSFPPTLTRAGAAQLHLHDRDVAIVFPAMIAPQAKGMRRSESKRGLGRQIRQRHLRPAAAETPQSRASPNSEIDDGYAGPK